MALNFPITSDGPIVDVLVNHEAAVLVQLWQQGIQRISEVFLSHADLDHFNRLPLLRKTSVSYAQRKLLVL
jgi:beta-lactamase superfamily II metal-dependent hydrolase